MSVPPAPSDELLRSILGSVKTIALVGASPKPHPPSNRVMRFLMDKGYHVIPINPGLAGGEINGEKVYETLTDIPDTIDMVDIFRHPDAVGEIVDAAITLAPDKGIRVIWMQLDVIAPEAAARADDAGLTVVMDHCPKIEYERLM